jgi:hypothetical protein
MRNTDLRERIGDVGEENRHELRKDCHESHEAREDLAVLDG